MTSRNHFAVFVLSACLVLSAAHAQVHTRLLYQNNLSAETQDDFAALTNHNGLFTPQGWQSTRTGVETGSKLIVAFNNRLPQTATIEWDIDNFNPYTQANSSKQHVAFLTSLEGGTADVLYGNGSWLYIRTGLNYRNADGSTSMKVDLGSMGLATRDEQFIFRNKFWDTGTKYTFKIVYDPSSLRLYINNELIRTLNFPGQVERFKYLYLGGDFTYPSIVGPVYSNLKIYTDQTELFFVDRTWTKGLVGLGAPDYSGHGIALGDVNRDGLVDVYVANCLQQQCRRDVLYIQQPDGTFKDETLSRGVEDECCSHGVVFFDADNDGDLDLFNANTWEPNQLYINDGFGYFSEESAARGIEQIDGETRGAVAFDANNDGRIDIFAVNWGMQNELYINQGDGTFAREIRGAEGAVEDTEKIGTQGVTVADIDNDGDYDIYISKRDKNNELYLNTDGYFTEVAGQRGVAVGNRSDGATFADYDNDGDMDLFVANTKQPDINTPLLLHVFENVGNGYFTDKTQSHNLVMDGFTAQLFDVDNDGDLDLYRLRNNVYDNTATAILSLNDGNGQFISAGYCGAAVIGGDARGTVYYDFDGDGDLDIYITAKFFENIYLQNESNITNNFINVSVTGPQGDLGGIGSKIDIYEAGWLGNPQKLLGHREVTTAVGYLSGISLEKHFGLGSRQSCDIRVTFSDKSVIDKSGVTANQKIAIPYPGETLTLEYVSGNDQSGFAFQPLARPFTVRIKNSSGIPQPGIDVRFELVQGRGVLAGESPVATDADGYASALLTLGPAPDTCVVRASSEVIPETFIEFFAYALPQRLLLAKVSGDLQTAKAGETLANPVVVQSFYHLGEPAANQPVDFMITSGGGSINGAQQLSVSSDNDGYASVLWTLGPTVGMNGLAVSTTDSSVQFLAEATVGDAFALHKLGAGNQPLIPGVPFPLPFSVNVTDKYGNSLPGHPVLFEVKEGDGHIQGQSSAEVLTNDGGIASVTWTPGGPYLGPANRLEATSRFNGVPLQNSPVSWEYPAIPVSPSLSTITATSPAIADGESRSEIKVRLKTEDGSSAGEGLAVSITASGENNSLVLPDSLSGENGEVTAYLTSLLPGIKVIKAQVLGLNLALNDSAVVQFNEIPAMIDSMFIVSGDDQTGTVGQALPEPIVVQLKDTVKKPVANGTVYFQSFQGECTFNGETEYITTTDGLGMARAVVALGPVAGIQNVARIHIPGAVNTPLYAYATSQAGAASQLHIVDGNFQTGQPHQPLPKPLRVRVSDAFGNPVSGYPVLFRVTSGDGHFLSASQAIFDTDASGIAAAAFYMGKATSCTVEVKTDFASVYFSLYLPQSKPDANNSGLVAASPVLPDGMARVHILVTVKDQYGEPVAGVGIFIRSTGSNNNIIQPQEPTNGEGMTTAYLSSVTEETKIISAFMLPDSIRIEQQIAVQFSSSPLLIEKNDKNSPNAVVNKPLEFPLQVRLTYQGQPVFGHPIRFAATAGGGHFDGEQHVTVDTDSSGAAQAVFTPGKIAATNIISVTDTLFDHVKTGYSFTAHADAPSALVKVAGDSQTVSGDEATIDLVVKVTDPYSNPTWHTPVNFSALNGGQVITPQPVFSDSSGMASCKVSPASPEGEYVFTASLEAGHSVSFVAFMKNVKSNHPPEIVAYEPADLEIYAYQSQVLLFHIVQARDEDGDSLLYGWKLNDFLIGQTAALKVVANQSLPPSFRITGFVSDGQLADSIAWHVDVLPTLVEEASLQANGSSGKGIRISWRIHSTAQNNSFNILRATQTDGLYRRINDRKIFALPGRTECDYVDSDISAGQQYFYKLEEASPYGTYLLYGPVAATISLPDRYSLLQNYPNPFNSSTTISYEVPETINGNLAVFDLNGRKIATIYDGLMQAGYHATKWPARDASGVALPSGVYYYKLETPRFTSMKKLILMR